MSFVLMFTTELMCLALTQKAACQLTKLTRWCDLPWACRRMRDNSSIKDCYTTCQFIQKMTILHEAKAM